METRPRNKEEVIAEVQKILEQKPIYLDTETTGFKPDSEIVSIGIVNWDGSILLNQLVKPTLPIPSDSSAIHGITDEMVKDAPNFLNVSCQIADCVENRTCVIYNRDFDLRMLRQSAESYSSIRRAFGDIVSVLVDPDETMPFCGDGLSGFFPDAMRLYADFLRPGGKWQKLGDAAKQCGIEPKGELHGAVTDAMVTREVMLYMRDQKEVMP